MVVLHLARTSRAAARAGFMEVALAVSPNWAPGEAYLLQEGEGRETARRKATPARGAAGSA